jgi:hypothetical protein
MGEPELKPENEKDLWCTESGFTLLSLGGETGQTLNVKRLEKIYNPAKNNTTLKANIAKRLGIITPAADDKIPAVHSHSEFVAENIRIEKFTYESEKDILVPAVIFKPADVDPDKPIYMYISDKGKPRRFDNQNIPLSLAKNGCIAMAIDVRGTGETSPTPLIVLDQSEYSENSPPNVILHYVVRGPHDIPAIHSPGFGHTMTGMRTFDVMRGIDLLTSREDTKGKKIVVASEGSAGIWALLTAIYKPQVYGIATLGTIPAYRLFITNQYYNLWDYFWVPGILRDFDIPDLVRLLSPKPQVWIDPVNATAGKFDFQSAKTILGAEKNLHIITPEIKYERNIPEIFKSIF